MADEARGSLFEASGLDCLRGGRAVFAGLGFALDAGGALILHGPNGSGKSSLLRILAGLLRPARGALDWAGRAVADDPEAHRARLHYVGHLDPLKPALTVAENVAFWAGLRGARARVPEALGHFGMAELAGLPARYLSAGQRRRANLARLLASPAPLWLLDEPTVTLDETAARALCAAIESHRAEGGLAVVATHGALALEDACALDLARFEAPAEAGG